MTGVEITLAQGLMLAGTGVTALGSIQQGNAAKQAANFNAQVANNNAIAARQNAAANAKRLEREARLRAGANIAASGASGVQVSGSVMDLLEDNAMEEELDRLTILHQGELQASGLESSATLLRAEGSAAQRAGFTGAAGTLLSGAGKLNYGGDPSSQPMGTISGAAASGRAGAGFGGGIVTP